MLDRVSSVDGVDGRRTCASVKPPLIVVNAKTMSCMNKDQKSYVFTEGQNDRDRPAEDLDHVHSGREKDRDID